MAAVQHFGGTNSANLAASTTNYGNLFNGRGQGTTEANAQVTIRTPGTFANLGTYVRTNTNTQNSTLTLRKNGADTAVVVTITGSTANTIFEDVVNSVSVAAGDLVNYKIATGAGGGTVQLKTVWNTFAATTGTVAIMSHTAGGDTLTGTADQYLQFSNINSGVTASTSAIGKFGGGGTLKNGMIYVTANTRSDTVTFRSYKQGVGAGNLAIAYATTSIGVVEDLVNTDAVATNDEWCWLVDQNGGSGTLSYQTTKVEFESTDSPPQFPIQAGTGGAPINFGTTVYSPIGGKMQQDTVEADSQMTARTPIIWQYLYGRCSAITLAGGASQTLTIRSRINAADGNQIIVMQSGTSTATDTTNTDSVVVGDELSMKLVTTGTSGDVTLRTVQWMAETIDNNGTASITLAALTLAGTGTVDIFGTASITISAMTLAGTGTVDVTGTASITLGALTAAATGTVEIAGAAAITLGTLTLAGTGTVAGGSGGTLGPLSPAATGQVLISGWLGTGGDFDPESFDPLDFGAPRLTLGTLLGSGTMSPFARPPAQCVTIERATRQTIRRRTRQTLERTTAVRVIRC